MNASVFTFKPVSLCRERLQLPVVLVLFICKYAELTYFFSTNAKIFTDNTLCVCERNGTVRDLV